MASLFYLQFSLLAIPLVKDSSEVFECLWYGGATFADFNNDGHLDIIYSGYTNNPPGNGVCKTLVYLNDGAGNFTKDLSQNIQGVWLVHDIPAGDIDNDGDIDIFIAGIDRNSSVYYSIIYTNDGTGKFYADNSQDITNFQYGGCDFFDCDNDGDLDLVILGQDKGGDPVVALYTNDGAGNFTRDVSQNFVNMRQGGIGICDVENDGDLDIITSGIDPAATRRIIVYTNNGKGEFSQIEDKAGLMNHGNMSFGDIDNDGYVDFAITGTDVVPLEQTKIYINNKDGTFTEINTPTVQDAYNGDAVLGDINNDGYLDLIVTGYRFGFHSYVYTNNGSGDFNRDFSSSLTGIYVAKSALGDIDKDGDLDLFQTGKHETGNPGGDPDTWIYTNGETTVNNIPTPPTIFNSKYSNGQLILLWNAGNDIETPNISLTYNIVVGTASNNYNIISKVNYTPGPGNCGMNKKCILNLPIGDYFWKVQTIDSVYARSVYSAEQSFRFTPQWISATAVSTNEIDLVWENVANETGYTLFSSTNNDTNTALAITNTGADVTNYDDTGLIINTKYYYWVKAYNISGGESGFSSAASNTTRFIEEDPFKVGILKFGPTTLFGNEKLYFANVTRDTEIFIYDVKGRLIWSADVTDPLKCITQAGYLYIKPEVTDSLADGIYIIVFKNAKDEPQVRKFNKITRKRK